MKFKTVHTYQSVRFNKRDETHFDVSLDKYKGIEMQYLHAEGVVRISISGVDDIVVFPTNVAYAIPMQEPAKKSSKA